ncbi:hypothetical protein GX408_16780, partial [bacterium]|nr:hypothetical protein [bacterium]
MMQEIKTVFLNSRPLQELCKALQVHKNVQASGANRTAQAFILDALAYRGKPVLCVLPGEEEAVRFYSDLLEISPHSSVVLFPYYDRQLWSELGPSAEAIGRKLLTLKTLLNESAPIIVVPAPALLEKVANPTALRRTQIYLQQGDELYFSDLVQTLVSMGYVREQRVEGPGEISVRGGLLDIFCYEEEHPCRIEFFGNTIESIRDFDVENQRSLSSRAELTVLPP